jgi:hypothetical protein
VKPIPSIYGRVACWGSLLLGLIILVACGEPSVPPAADIISKSATAMRDVQSMSFSLDTNKLDKYPQSLFLLSANGEVARPDKLHAKAKALLVGTAIQIEAVSLGNQQYMTDPASGRWQVMPPSFNVLAAFDPNKGISDILANAKDLQNDGTETIDGTACYRLKATLSPDSLRALSTEVNASQPLNSRLWIGSADSLLRQVELSGPLMQDEPANIVRTIKFAQFNGQFAFPQPTVGAAPASP